MKLVMTESDKKYLLNNYIASMIRGNEWAQQKLQRLNCSGEKSKAEILDRIQVQCQTLQDLYDLIESSACINQSVIPYYGNIEVKD